MTSGMEERDRMLSLTNDVMTEQEATPWHKGMTGERTQVVDGSMSMEDALDAAGMTGWDIGKLPTHYWVGTGVTAEQAGTDLQFVGEGAERVGIFSPDGVPMMVRVSESGELQRQEVTNDCFAMVRQDTGDQLGKRTVGKVQTWFDNEELGQFADELAGGGGRVETLGSLWSNAKVWILVRLDREVTIAGEEATPYLLLVNSHDGTGKLSVYAVTIRVVCQNTLDLAVSGARQRWDCRHTGQLASRVNEARKSLELGFRYFDSFEEEVAKLIATPVTSTQFVSFSELLAPMPEAKVLARDDNGAPTLQEAPPARTVTAVEKKRGELRGLWQAEHGAGNHQGNAYGAMMAVNTHALWATKGRGDSANESQQRRIISGAVQREMSDARVKLETVLAA